MAPRRTSAAARAGALKREAEESDAAFPRKVHEWASAYPDCARPGLRQAGDGCITTQTPQGLPLAPVVTTAPS